MWKNWSFLYVVSGSVEKVPLRKMIQQILDKLNLTYHTTQPFHSLEHSKRLAFHFMEEKCKKNEDIYPQKNLYTRIHNSNIHNSQRAEITRFIHWWMDNQVSFIHMMKHHLAIKRMNYMEEPCKHVKWKKPDSNDHILYDSTYTKYPE